MSETYIQSQHLWKRIRDKTVDGWKDDICEKTIKRPKLHGMYVCI